MGFKLKDDTHEVIISVYVEDLVILSPKRRGVKCQGEVEKSLFLLTELWNQKCYLEISSRHIADTMFLSQSAYCSGILNQIGMKKGKTG